jgi:hypothetical protein
MKGYSDRRRCGAQLHRAVAAQAISALLRRFPEQLLASLRWHRAPASPVADVRDD